MINCLIIDDEPLALDLLEDYLTKIPFARLIAKCNEPLLALDYMNQTPVDLILLDIKMPDISGVEFYKSLRQKPAVIFTTAYSEYALEGFELNAVDYLLKPISFERFVAAVNKAQDFIDHKHNKNHNKDYFFVNVSHKIHKIRYCDIQYLEGFKDYTKIYLNNQQHPLLVLQNLKHFEDMLPQDEFIRVHRSYIISMSKLSTLTRKSVVIGNITMPVSDNYRDKLFALVHPF